MQLRTVLLSSTPGVPPPPPMTEDAQRHFQTLGNFEVVSVGGVQPVAPVSPFNHHAQSPVSRGMPSSATPMFTPIRGGMVRPVSPTRPASGINSPAPGTSEFQAVGTAIGALSDALQGSVSGLESLATPLHGAPDIDTVEKCRAVRGSCVWVGGCLCHSLLEATRGRSVLLPPSPRELTAAHCASGCCSKRAPPPTHRRRAVQPGPIPRRCRRIDAPRRLRTTPWRLPRRAVAAVHAEGW